MSAHRPAILEALKALLVTGLPDLSGRVYLPWEPLPETGTQPLVQFDVDDSQIDDSETIGSWVQTMPVRIGYIRYGKFDYAATWQQLNTITGLIRNASISGIQRIDITGAADNITEAGNKILWPHLAVDVVYLTAAGEL
jgi:hypothetical protein